MLSLEALASTAQSIDHLRRPAFRDRTVCPVTSIPATPRPSSTTDPGSGTDEIVIVSIRSLALNK